MPLDASLAGWKSDSYQVTWDNARYPLCARRRGRDRGRPRRARLRHREHGRGGAAGAADIPRRARPGPVRHPHRLSGDRNPLHSDPGFAAAGGFPRPILHGLCTYGIAGRALLHGAAGGDPSRLRAVSARVSAPVTPGAALRTSIWLERDDVLFMTHTEAGTAVLTHGRAAVAGGAR